MSRSYFVKIYLDKKYPINTLKDFFYGYFSKFQIVLTQKFEKDYVSVILGCSNGVSVEESMNELKEQLLKNNFDVLGILVYSLHPDNMVCSWDKLNISNKL